MPKCAGSSVKSVLKESIGGRFVEDYQSFCKVPQSEPRRAIVLESLLQPARLPQGSFVFGHYYPVKYIGAIDRINTEDFCLITFLRNPTERLVVALRFLEIKRYLRPLPVEGNDFRKLVV